jgi:EAL domain-containing protein (putative c-di-GMP-specific phosphodiesterase class I)
MNGSASIGIASAGHGPEAPEDILHCADLAMYRAKRAGGGRHEVFDLSDRRLASGDAGLERDLRDPLRGGELHLDYQPIVATSDGRVRGVEALLRWAHPSHGLVPPSVLIPLAERARLIPAIGKWVLETAMAEQAHWQHDYGVNDVAIAVNVSAHQLMSAGFVDAVAALLERSPSDPGQLILEMTESVFVRDDQRALLVLDDLKALGVKLALDDFGTGCSSLTHLLQFPVDIVKIDRVFVAGLGHDDANQAIVSTVTKLAHNLGLTVVAEGVETLEQYQAIVELCSDLCQGFYLAHPMPGAQLDVLIERGANGSNQSLRYSLAPKPSRASLGPADLLKSSWSRRRDAHQPVLLGARTGDEQGASTATMGIRPTLPPAYAR